MLANHQTSVTHAMACQLVLLLSGCAAPQPGITSSNVSVLVDPVPAIETTPPASNEVVEVVTAPVSIMGNWSEQWGIPGESDVEYHDQFVIERREGRTDVRILNRDQRIEAVVLRGLHLSFVLHTDTLAVRYELDFQRRRDAWVGEAENDNGRFAITWSRLE